MKLIKVFGEVYTQEEALKVEKLILWEAFETNENEIDISKLSFFPNLKTLVLYNNKLVNFECIEDFKNLTSLSLISTDCPNYSSISKLENLECINLGEQIKSLDHILNLKNLKYVRVSTMNYDIAIQLKSMIPGLLSVDIPSFLLNKKELPKKVYKITKKQFALKYKNQLEECINSLDFVIKYNIDLDKMSTSLSEIPV